MIKYLLDFRLYVVLSFFSILNHMDMNWFVVIGVELENITEEYEYGWNTLILLFFAKINKNFHTGVFYQEKQLFSCLSP